MKLKLTPRAIADLERIYLESARSFGISQADAYQAGLRNSLDLIGEHPLMTRERTGFRRPVRIHSYESHVIVYLVRDIVLVIRILHAHQNLRRILYRTLCTAGQSAYILPAARCVLDTNIPGALSILRELSLTGPVGSDKRRPPA